MTRAPGLAPARLSGLLGDGRGGADCGGGMAHPPNAAAWRKCLLVHPFGNGRALLWLW